MQHELSVVLCCTLLTHLPPSFPSAHAHPLPPLPLLTHLPPSFPSAHPLPSLPSLPSCSPLPPLPFHCSCASCRNHWWPCCVVAVPEPAVCGPLLPHCPWRALTPVGPPCHNLTKGTRGTAQGEATPTFPPPTAGWPHMRVCCPLPPAQWSRASGLLAVNASRSVHVLSREVLNSHYNEQVFLPVYVLCVCVFAVLTYVHCPQSHLSVCLSRCVLFRPPQVR